MLYPAKLKVIHNGRTYFFYNSGRNMGLAGDPEWGSNAGYTSGAEMRCVPETDGNGYASAEKACAEHNLVQG